MSERTKLQPEDLTAEERALWDALAVERVTRNSCCPEQAYEFTDDWASRIILARRALFAPATEKNKCVLHEEVVRGGPSKWTCETHPQPEPAAPVNGHTPIGEYDPDMKPAAQVTGGYQPIDRGEIKSPPQGGTGTVRPAATEMPEAVRNASRALHRAAGFYQCEAQPVESIMRLVEAANTLESWWRTHSQPVAVGMTEELSMVLLRAEYGATEDERNPNLRDGYVARLKDAIAAVREQAAQGPKVELPKVREFLERKGWSCEQARARLESLAELDAAEGRK